MQLQPHTTKNEGMFYAAQIHTHIHTKLVTRVFIFIKYIHIRITRKYDNAEVLSPHPSPLLPSPPSLPPSSSLSLTLSRCLSVTRSLSLSLSIPLSRIEVPISTRPLSDDCHGIRCICFFFYIVFVYQSRCSLYLCARVCQYLCDFGHFTNSVSARVWSREQKCLTTKPLQRKKGSRTTQLQPPIFP